MIKAYIDFRMPHLFVEEIELSAEEIDSKIVRVGSLWKRDHANPHCDHVFVMATAIQGDLVLRLTHPVGTMRGVASEDKKVEDKAGKIEKDLEKQLTEIGMDVRSGRVTAIVPEAA
jgi:hypothetical protein